MSSTIIRLGCRRRLSSATASIISGRPLFYVQSVPARHFSARSSEGEEQENGHRIEQIYEGGLTPPVKTLKRVSITTCIISVIGIPALLLVGNNDVPAAGQLAVAGTTITAAVGSTLLLHACLSPYVLFMSEIVTGNVGSGEEASDPTLDDKPRRFKAQRLNMLGGLKSSEFSLDEVEPQPNAMRPFVSFRAGNQLYYLQGSMMQDKELLKTFLGRPLRETEM